MEIKTSFGAGGVGLNPGYPAGGDLATALRDIADDLGGLKPVTAASADVSAVATADVGETYGVADGFVTGAPTTPSVQSVDPGGETSWHVNLSAGYVFCNGVGFYSAAQVDFDVSTGAKIMDIGQSMYAWLVVHEAAGTVAMHVVLGTAAADGAETIPDDAAITASVGHARWTKLALVHAHRHADAVVQCTEDPSLMKKWGGAGTTLINELKTRAAEVRALLNEIKGRLNTPAGVTLKTTKG